MEKDHIAGKDTKVAVNSDGHFSEFRDTDLRAKVNTAFIADFERHSTPQTNGETSSGAEFGEHSIDQAIGVIGANNTDGVVKTFDDSKEFTASLCDEPVFRNKVFKTVFLLWIATCLGWGYGLMGPIFPDLQDLAGVSLKQGSWLFTGFAIGYLGGCLLGGFTQSRFSPNLMLFLYTLVSATMLPWILTFPVMVFLRVLNAIGMGGQDTGFLTMLFAIWGNKVGPVNQMIYVLTALGGIVSPLVSKPFLRKVSQNNQVEASNSTESALLLNSTVTVNCFIEKAIDTAVIGTNEHYALAISALLYLSAAVPFIVAFIKEPKAKIVREKA